MTFPSRNPSTIMTACSYLLPPGPFYFRPFPLLLSCLSPFLSVPALETGLQRTSLPLFSSASVASTSKSLSLLGLSPFPSTSFLGGAASNPLPSPSATTAQGFSSLQATKNSGEKGIKEEGGEGEQKKLIRTSERVEKMASSFEDFVSIFILCFVFVGLVSIFICFPFLRSLETWFLRT